MTIYGQQEVVKDFVTRQLADGAPILFEVEDVSVREFDSTKPKIRFRHDGQAHELDCDFIAGCDGFHGITRESIPPGVLTTYERDYPFGWLGILSQSPPPDEELIYSYHERGFALYTMRSPTLARLYFQCAPDEDIDNWPDERIWQEFHLRLGGARDLARRRDRAEEHHADAQLHGRADAIRPAVSRRRCRAYRSADRCQGHEPRLRRRAPARARRRRVLPYRPHRAARRVIRATCLRRAWKAQRFSWWMTQLLHLFPGDTPFDQRRQLAELDYIAGSQAASTALAENYVGLPVD